MAQGMGVVLWEDGIGVAWVVQVLYLRSVGCFFAGALMEFLDFPFRQVPCFYK
jgi:hypothetical protein